MPYTPVSARTSLKRLIDSDAAIALFVVALLVACARRDVWQVLFLLGVLLAVLTIDLREWRREWRENS